MAGVVPFAREGWERDPLWISRKALIGKATAKGNRPLQAPRLLSVVVLSPATGGDQAGAWRAKRASQRVTVLCWTPSTRPAARMPIPSLRSFSTRSTGDHRRARGVPVGSLKRLPQSRHNHCWASEPSWRARFGELQEEQCRRENCVTYTLIIHPASLERQCHAG
jgi:hypothetical protein